MSATTPAPSPEVYATVINVQSGQVMEQFGPFDSAYLARAACGQATGQALLWTRDDLCWIAQVFPLEYQVPVDLADRLAPA